MENHTKEILSDSDSSSWVLLDEKHSDIESDTDSIGVISESDDNLNEFSPVRVQEIFNICNEKDNEAEGEEHIQDSIETSEEPNTEILPFHSSSFTLKKMFDTITLISTGVAVIALLITPLMTSKSNEIVKKNVEPYQDRMSIAKPLQPLISSVRNSKIKDVKIPIYTANKNSPNHKKYKNSNLSNHQKQMKNGQHFMKPDKQQEYEMISKKFKKIAQKLKSKEEYLSKREKYLIEREFNILAKEVELQQMLSDKNLLDKKSLKSPLMTKRMKRNHQQRT